MDKDPPRGRMPTLSCGYELFLPLRSSLCFSFLAQINLATDLIRRLSLVLMIRSFSLCGIFYETGSSTTPDFHPHPPTPDPDPHKCIQTNVYLTRRNHRFNLNLYLKPNPNPNRNRIPTPAPPEPHVPANSPQENRTSLTDRVLETSSSSPNTQNALLRISLTSSVVNSTRY